MGRGLPVHRDVPGPAVRHDPRDGPHRDHHGRLRDGGDPLRAARPLRGPERRPLGLHLQRHQELPRSRTAVRPARPRQRDDDGPVHEGVHRAARRHLPPARRAGHRRHERVHPQPPRPGGHRARRSRRCAPTRSARRGRGTTARGWRTPTSCRSRARCSTRPSATGSTSAHRLREDVHVTAADLLDIPSAGGGEPGAVTDAGLRGNVSVGVRYLEAWLRGVGAVAIDHLMEDAATAEISRSQVWQWVHQEVVTAEGTRIDAARVEQVLTEVLAELAAVRRRPVRRRGRPVPAGRARGGLPDVPHRARVHAVPRRARVSR